MNTDVYIEDKEQRTKSKTLSFLKATYQLFAGSLFFACAGAYVGLEMVSYLMGMLFWGLISIEAIMILLIIPRTKHIPKINFFVLFLFTFITGLIIAPSLWEVMQIPEGALIVGQCFLMTAVSFGSLSIFAMSTTRNFSSIGKILFIALILIIVASASNLFFQSSMLQLGIAAGSSLLFSVFILYDTQKIVKGECDSPIEAALTLYLDFLTLFVSLLQLLHTMASADKK